MFKLLFRLVLLVVIVVAIGGFMLGWWATGADVQRTDLPEEVGTAGRTTAERAREVGGEVGERAAVAADRAREVLEDGALTAKIKSKMTLDDTLKASRIDVDTSNRVVTLNGTVASEAQRERALQLARETNGVKQVVDRLTIR